MFVRGGFYDASRYVYSIFSSFVFFWFFGSYIVASGKMGEPQEQDEAVKHRLTVMRFIIRGR